MGSAPTTKTGNGESVAELAVLLMLAVSRLNEELAVTKGHAQVSAKLEVNRALFGKTACIPGSRHLRLRRTSSVTVAFEAKT